MGVADGPPIRLLAVVIVALLYYATPNVKQPKFRWLSIGAAVAIITAVVVEMQERLTDSTRGSMTKRP